MANFCPSCGKPLPYQDAEICPACGALVQPLARETRIRNPLVAVALSFLFPGWGQWYNGRRWDGLKFFGASALLAVIMVVSAFLMMGQGFTAIALSVVLSLAALGIWIYGMYDAYRTAERINRGETAFQRKSHLFWLPVVLIVGGMFLTLALSALIAAFVFGMAGPAGSYGGGGYEHTKVVAATARQMGNTIFVTWQGGLDNDLVSSYSVAIISSTGVTSSAEDLPPDIGDMNQFEGGTSGNDHVVVTAIFNDGSLPQVVLDTYV
ncbi:MAG: zinc ribbon domain-containing protein [Methanomicrobiales archaeon]|nr:zinc ribbon domain-containing protein [Methanomicrobiales archaeon]